MEDRDKTSGQPAFELSMLRQRVVEFEASEINLKQSDDSLPWNEEKIDLMLQSIGDHISMMDRDLNIIWANQIAKDSFGNDIIGKKCYEIYHKRTDPCEPYPCLTLKAFQDGRVHEHNTEVIDKDGSIIHFHCTANVALRDSSGTPTAVIEISRDITEQKRAEKVLRESEAWYRTVFENTGTAIIIIEDDMTISKSNKDFAKLSGYSRDEIDGKKKWTEFIVDEDLERMKELHLIRRQEGKTPTTKYEFRSVDRYGTIKDMFLNVGMIPGTKKSVVSLIDITGHKQAEKLYQTLAEKSWAAVYVVQDGVLQLLNSRGASYIGYTPEELIGKPSINFVHHEDRERAVKNAIAMLKGEQTSPYEFRVIAKDGTIRWIMETITPIIYKGRRATLGNSMDVTERKIIEKALQQSEERNRTLIESTFDLVFTVDSRQVFTYINPRFEEVTGYSLLDLKDQSFTYVLAPEYREQSVTRFKRAMKGEAVSPYEADLINKDGRRIAVEFLVITLYDTTGKPTGRFGVGRDITQRKQAEKALLESEEKYHSLVSFTEDFMYLIDGDLRYIFMNEGYRKRYGLDLNEFTKKAYADFHSEDQVKAFSAEVTRVFETGESTQNEVRSNVDGRYYLRTMSPVKGEGGKITAVSVVSKDITDRKNAEEQLERHREHLRLINQILRHDIINDLSVVKSGLRIYKTSRDEGLLDEIIKKVDKGVKLIREMRELETFILSHRELEFIDIGDIFKEVIENYPSTEFTVEGKGKALADETFRSIIDNIIRNAIDHGKADRIKIAIEKKGNFCEVRIADYGTGIPDAIKERIFEEGFSYGEAGHTGFGLHIVKKTMQRYGGSVYVEDNNPKGAVVVLKLRIVRQGGMS